MSPFRSWAATAALLLATAALAAPAVAAAPDLPASDLTIAFDPASVRVFGRGGDIWPTVTLADGTVLGAWGDGKVTCAVKVSFGTAVMPATPKAHLTSSGCGPQGSRGGKIAGLRRLPGGTQTVWALLNAQDKGASSSMRLLRTTDNGRSWRVVGTRVNTRGFWPVSFLPDSPGVGFTYVLEVKGGLAASADLYLSRVPNPQLGKLASTRSFFTGLDDAGAPTWGAPGNATPIIAGASPGLDYPTLSYLAAQDRYVLAAGLGAPDTNALFEAEEPWGPYRTVDWTTSGWLGRPGGPGERQELSFPTAYQTAKGGTAVAGCWGAGCGAADDSGQLIRYTVTQATPVPTPTPTQTPAARTGANTRPAAPTPAKTATVKPSGGTGKTGTTTPGTTTPATTQDRVTPDTTTPDTTTPDTTTPDTTTPGAGAASDPGADSPADRGLVTDPSVAGAGPPPPATPPIPSAGG